MIFMIINIIIIAIITYFLNQKIVGISKKLTDLENKKVIIPTEITSGNLFKRLYGKI